MLWEVQRKVTLLKRKVTSELNDCCLLLQLDTQCSDLSEKGATVTVVMVALFYNTNNFSFEATKGPFIFYGVGGLVGFNG